MKAETYYNEKDNSTTAKVELARIDTCSLREGLAAIIAECLTQFEPFGHPSNMSEKEFADKIESARKVFAGIAKGDIDSFEIRVNQPIYEDGMKAFVDIFSHLWT